MLQQLFISLVALPLTAKTTSQYLKESNICLLQYQYDDPNLVQQTGA
jgi:hypothetical protein